MYPMYISRRKLLSADVDGLFDSLNIAIRGLPFMFPFVTYCLFALVVLGGVCGVTVAFIDFPSN